MDNKTLKDLYNYAYIDNPEYSLEMWFNHMLDKTETELTLFDVTRDLMQKMFLDTTIPLALAYLADNVLAGEYYAGNLLELVSRLDQSELAPYKETFEKILPVAHETLNNYEWESDEDRLDFVEDIQRLEEKML